MHGVIPGEGKKGYGAWEGFAEKEGF